MYRNNMQSIIQLFKASLFKPSVYFVNLFVIEYCQLCS